MRIITINILNYIFANALCARIRSTCEHTHTPEERHTRTRKKRKKPYTYIQTSTRAIHGRRRRRQFQRATDPCSSLGIVHYSVSFILCPSRPSSPLNLQDFHATSNVYLFRDVVPVFALLYSRND